MKSRTEEELTEIPKKHVLVYDIVIPANECLIRWMFRTKKRGIIFGLAYHGEISEDKRHLGPLMGTSQTPNSRFSILPTLKSSLGADLPRLSCKNFLSVQEAEHELSSLNWLLPLEKYDSQELPVFGSYLAKNSGTYLFIFDNRDTKGTARLAEFTIELSSLNKSQDREFDVRLSGWMYKKKRKPLQGWAKRWLKLENSILSYSKSENGKKRGVMNLRMVTMTVEKQRRIINLDSGDFLFHLKAFNEAEFSRWIRAFRSCQTTPSVTFESLPDSLNSQSMLESGVVSLSKMDQMDLALKDRNSAFNRFTEQLGFLLSEFKKSKDDVSNQHIMDLKTINSDLKSLLKAPNISKSDGPFLNDVTSKISKTISLAEALSKHYKSQAKQQLQHLQKLEPLIRQIVNETHGRSRYGTKSIVIDAFGHETVYNRFSSTNSTASDHYFDAIERFEGTVNYEEYTAESDESDDILEDEISSEEDDISIRTSLRRDLEVSEQMGKTLDRRKVLAMPISESSMSLFSFLRQNLGKDLTKVSIPVHFNEPLSVLQRLAEELEYCELLDKAASLEFSIDRLLYVSIFAISGYASSVNRTRKPFNPILGETYELMRADKGFRYIAEKVSHHPLVVACHADSEHYEFWQTSTLKTKFWGKSMELIPMGTVHTTLSPYGDHFVWNKVTTCVKNLLSSKKWVEHYGEMIVTNVKTQEFCKIVFKEAGHFNYGSKNEFVASLHSASGEIVKTLVGKWNDAVFEQIQEDQLKLLWKPNPLPEDNEKYYGFTQFALELNELTQDLATIIPSTDSRFRNDQRLMEEGRLDEAEREKQRLEQKQRDVRKHMDQHGQSYSPRWFRSNLVDKNVSSIQNRYLSGRRSSSECIPSQKSPEEDSTKGSPGGLAEEWLSNRHYWANRSKKAYPPPFVSFDRA